MLRSDRVGTSGFVEDVQRAIWSVNASLPLAGVQSMGDVYQRSLARTSLTLLLLGITASMALLLGVIGVYGVISYSLAQRTHEIGIRIALGAPSAALKRLVLGHVALLVGIGVAIGLVGAAALTRLMRTFLFGVGALDPATYVTVCALLVGSALVAGYLPARRAARVDPMVRVARGVGSPSVEGFVEREAFTSRKEGFCHPGLASSSAYRPRDNTRRPSKTATVTPHTAARAGRAFQSRRVHQPVSRDVGIARHRIARDTRPRIDHAVAGIGGTQDAISFGANWSRMSNTRTPAL